MSADVSEPIEVDLQRNIGHLTIHHPPAIMTDMRQEYTIDKISACAGIVIPSEFISHDHGKDLNSLVFH
jgi:hypothetical protein